MKKIIYTILILFAFIYKVDAKEIYYSDYSDFSDYSLEKYESSELVNIEVERRYRFYEEKIIGEYRSYLDDNSNFKYVDLNNRKDTPFSSWSKEEVKEETYRTIESKTVYSLKKPKPIRYIFFVNSLDVTLQLHDVEVYYLDQKIDYDLYFDNANEDLNIYYGGYIRLDLKNYYDLKNITIKIKSIDFDHPREFVVAVSRKGEFDFFKNTYFSTNISGVNPTNIVIDKNSWIKAFTEYDEEVFLDYNPNEPLAEITEIKLYRYQDPLFYFYNIERKYAAGYFKNCDNLIKDENDYKDYYRYQSREKIELEDEIIITDYEQNLSDFINSTVDYEIITNLDVSKNGAYEVEYKTPFINLKKNVIVNIKKNELNNLEGKYNALVLELNALKNKYDSLNSELIRVKDEKNNLSLNLEEIKKLYDNLNTKIEETNKNDMLVLEIENLKKLYDDTIQKMLKLESEKSNLKLMLEEIQAAYEKLNLEFNTEKDNNVLILENLKNIYIKTNNELLELKNSNHNLNFKLEELENINREYIEQNNKLNSQLEKLSLEFIRVDDNYNTLNSIINNNENKFKTEINMLTNNYNNLLNKYEELKTNDYKLELDEALTKLNNNNDRLDLIEFTNNQLQNNLLTLGNKKNLLIGKFDLLWIILGLIFIFIVFLTLLKKMSNKNKF